MTTAPVLAPLAMSQTKDDLLRHLNMTTETYALISKEVDKVYTSLTSEKRHLKPNCKRKPPYDWSDIKEGSKDEAIALISRSGSEHTTYYWNLASPTPDCQNWIAKWFLYHKFRYRDGRNRSSARLTDGHRPSHHSSSSSSRHTHPNVSDQNKEGGQVAGGSTHQSPSTYADYYSNPGQVAHQAYSAPSTTASEYQPVEYASYTAPPYDPVRDV